MTKRGRKKRRKAAQVSPRIRPYIDPEPAYIRSRPRNEQLISELQAAADRHLDTRGVTLERLDLPDATESIVFGCHKMPLAYVFANMAAAHHGPRRTIDANFRGPGEHWAELRALLLELQGSEERAADLPEMSTILTSLPPFVPTELASAVLRASARIRAEIRVFPCPVVLVERTTKSQVRFEPIRLHPRLLVPFIVREANGVEIEAALDLTSTTGPIAVAFQDSADEARIIDAWPIALLAFADLISAGATDVKEETPARRRHRGDRPAAPRVVDTLLPLRRRTASRRGGRSVGSSTALRPIGETAGYQGSFVAGYRRRLPLGQSSGEQARAAARIYGIELHAGWTWVQPHKRGLPDGFVLRYSWSMPSQLRDVVSLDSV